MNDFVIIKTMSTNNYIIKGDKACLLIDAGMGDKYDSFKKRIEKKGINMRDIKYVLLTHHHSDHNAYLNPLREEYGTKIIVHKNEVEDLKNGRNKLGTYRQTVMINLTRKLLANLIKPDFDPVVIGDNDIVIKDDDNDLLRNELGIDAKIIHTPGHTMGSISVVMNDIAFVGDSVMNFIVSSPYPMLYEDETLVFKSWKKLIDNGVRFVYPAHGDKLPVTKLKKLL